MGRGKDYLGIKEEAFYKFYGWFFPKRGAIYLEAFSASKISAKGAFYDQKIQGKSLGGGG